MKTLRKVLAEADPLRHESAWTRETSQATRQVVVNTMPRAEQDNSRRIAIGVLIAVAVITSPGIGFFLPRSVVAAAIRFEMRLADARPAPGLTEAIVAGSDDKIYLHSETIVTNGDVADVRVIEANARFQLAVRFTTEGARRMLRATESHVGRPVAILLDDQVVAAPTVRDPISEAAILDGRYTRAEAERIAAGIRAR
jgi:hypothetical protein